MFARCQIHVGTNKKEKKTSQGSFFISPCPKLSTFFYIYICFFSLKKDIEDNNRRKAGGDRERGRAPEYPRYGTLSCSLQDSEPRSSVRR